jgi:hypothetical protein
MDSAVLGVRPSQKKTSIATQSSVHRYKDVTLTSPEVSFYLTLYHVDSLCLTTKGVNCNAPPGAGHPAPRGNGEVQST